MKNKNKVLVLLGGMSKLAKPTAVNGSRIMMLLLFTVAFFFSVNAQYTKMYEQFKIMPNRFQNLFNDTVGKRLILTDHVGFKTLNNQDLLPGSNVVFFDKATGKAMLAPDPLKNAKHVYLYDNKLFYIKDSVKVFSYDLATSTVKLCAVANDRIINFWCMPNSRLLINARSGGNSTIGSGPETATATRLAIFDYEHQTVQNISDNPYIFQAFACGDWIVYQESGYWFGKKGADKISIQNIHTGKTFYRTDVYILYRAIPVSDSTFLMWYYPQTGGGSKIAKVNVLDVRNTGDIFYRDDVLNMGSGGWAPPVAGNDSDPVSPIPYFIDGQWCNGDFPYRNIKTNEEIYPATDEIWFWDLATLRPYLAGKFVDTVTNMPIGNVFNVDNRYVTFGWLSRFITTELYGPKQTTGVSTTAIAGLSVYPNPTSDGAINLNMPRAGKIEVYSISGQLQFSQNLEAGGKRVQNVFTLPGVYYIKVTIGNQVQTFKVLSQ